MAATDVLLSSLQTCNKVSSQIDSFLEKNDLFDQELLAQSKALYDFGKSLNYGFTSNSLKELLTTGFDHEQIFQQLELENISVLQAGKKALKTLLNNVKVKNDESEVNTPHELEDGDAKDELEFEEEGLKEDIETENEDTQDINSDEEDDQNFVDSNNHNYRKTVVDDDFFKLGQMEEFLQREDRKWMNRDNADVIEDNEDSDEEDEDEDIDYFGSRMEEEDDASAADAVYADFFDPIKVTKSKTDAKAMDPEGIEGEEKSEDEDSSFDEDNSSQSNIIDSKSEKLSSFELSQEKMLKTIKRLEEANLDKKSWQLMGESTASQRPTNSLLEEHVSFEHTSLGAPEITEETTEKIEDLILQRIKDQAWDDVERRLKNVVQPHEYKKAPELNQEKSKLSLAEVYEKEYLDKTKVETEEKESEEHAAIRISMQKLFSKLDALTNFRYTQKPPNPEVQIITNTRSLDMEEITPVAVTETMQLAPEELHTKQRGDTIGDTERTDEDRKRARRKKKLKKKYAAKEKEKKIQEKAAAGDSKALKIAEKRKAEDSLKKSTHVTMVNGSKRQETIPKSSSDFFNKLQNDAQIAINKNKNQHTEQKIKKRKTEFLKL